jgi:hypothetical protein
MITTFAQREKAENIYKTYFDINSDNYLGFDFFDSLNYMGALKDKKTSKLCRTFYKMGENLYNEISNFDKKQLDATKK